MMNEHIYSDEQVSISASAAVLDGISYPIATISEVFILDRRPERDGQTKGASPIFSVIYCTAMFSAAGLLALYCSQMSEPANTVLSLPGFLAGGVLSVALFILVICLADKLTGQNHTDCEQNLPDYTLVIATRAGYRSAISSHDRWYIERIEGCIQYAISLSAEAQKKSKNLCSIC